MDGLLQAVFAGYVLCGCLYGWYFIQERPLAGTLAHAAGWAVFLVHTVFIVLSGIHSRVLPVAGLFASLLFFAWLIMLGHLLVELWSHQRVNGVFVLPLNILLTGFAMQVDKAARPLPPALQSPWLGIHVSLCFLGYACFLLAFSFAVMYLWQEHEVKSKRIDRFFFRLPALGTLDLLGYRSVVVGFIFLSLGILSGSVWAQVAWGRFWSWDPKETWALVLWLVYVFYLHTRVSGGWHGKRSAYIAIIGFVIMLFTYLGVSFILPGLHSYL